MIDLVATRRHRQATGRGLSAGPRCRQPARRGAARSVVTTCHALCVLTLAITFYDVVLTVHILAVVVAFGVVFAYPVLDAQVRRASPADVAALHRLHVVLARRVITPAMTVVLLAGLYLAIDRWSLGDPWISATFAILFVLFGLNGGVLVPADVRLAELAEGDGAGSEAYERQRRKADMFGGLALLLVVVAIFLMVAKPGA
jgi:hypothetical protein